MLLVTHPPSGLTARCRAVRRVMVGTREHLLLDGVHPDDLATLPRQVLVGEARQALDVDVVETPSGERVRWSERIGEEGGQVLVRADIVTVENTTYDDGT
jgi:hypothetical protein